MREIRTSGLMSGEGKRSDANAVQTTAPFLDSTLAGRALDKIAAHMGPTECKGHFALAKASESLVGAIAVADDDRVEEAFGEQLLRRLGAARGVDMERDRVIADRDPQPGAARAVFPAKFLDAPAGLVGMAQRRLVLVRKDRLGQRLEQRHEPLQAVGQRPRRDRQPLGGHPRGNAVHGAEAGTVLEQEAGPEAGPVERPGEQPRHRGRRLDPSRKSGGALHRLHCFCLEFDGACEVQRRVPTDWIIEPIDVSGYGSFSLAS